MIIRKILVPLDFSETSRKALTYAVTLAVQFKAGLVLVHVVPESSALAYAFPTETATIEADQRDKALHELGKIIPDNLASGLEIRRIVKTGNIGDELLGIARDEGGHQEPCSALTRKFSATSACQNSLAFEVSTSNSNRATMSGSMSATST